MAQVPVWAKVRSVVALVHAVCGGVTHDTPAQASAHAPLVQAAGQVVSTASYWHWPATQRPTKVWAVVALVQLAAGGALQVTLAHDGSTSTPRWQTPAWHE